MSEQRPRSGTDWTTPGEGTDGGDDFRTPRGGGGGDDSHGGVRNRDAAAAQRRGALPPSTAGLKWRRRALEGEARADALRAPCARSIMTVRSMAAVCAPCAHESLRLRAGRVPCRVRVCLRLPALVFSCVAFRLRTCAPRKSSF